MSQLNRLKASKSAISSWPHGYLKAPEALDARSSRRCERQFFKYKYPSEGV